MIKTSCPNYVMIYCLAKFYSFISPITNQNVKCFVQCTLFTSYYTSNHDEDKARSFQKNVHVHS